MKRCFSFSVLWLFVSVFLNWRTVYACGLRNTAHIAKYANPGDDVTAILQELVNKYSTVIIDEGTWYLTPGIKLRSGVTIKGTDKNTSILKRKEEPFGIVGGMLFYTEKANPDIYSRKNPADDYAKSRIKYKNIHIDNLTLDFNRHPDVYSHQQMKGTNLYGIGLMYSTDCSVENCSFVDYMTPEANNGYPAIVFLQSDHCNVTNCQSQNITLVQSIYSENVTISGNHSENSVGTCIESICGKRCVVSDNYVKGVYWKVSCVGINTAGSKVHNNEVYAGANNISCLTLGHQGYELVNADNAVVENNYFISEGVRSIIIQNGANIEIKNNRLSCVLSEESPTPTFGCIVARGEVSGIRDLLIENNNMVAYGDKVYGVVTYAGSGCVKLNRNKIDGKRGVSIIADGVDIEIKNNIINSSDYTVTATSPKSLLIESNVLAEGISVKGGESLEIRDNHFLSISRSSYVYGEWDNVRIINNEFIIADNAVLEQLFLFNAERKDGSYDLSKFVTYGNLLDASIQAVKFVNFSGNNNARQLRSITIKSTEN